MDNKILDLLSDKRLRTSLEIIEELGLGQENDEMVIDTLNRLTDEYTLYCTRKGKYSFCGYLKQPCEHSSPGDSLKTVHWTVFALLRSAAP